MIKPKLTKEFEEMKDFMNFVERTGRLEQINYIDRYHAKKTPDCIHILEDFSATATQKHPKIEKHLKRLDNDYTPYREHALDCERCQASLDSFFTFKGYQHRILFPQIPQKILEQEWELTSDRNVYLCKLPAPGFNYSELTYVTGLSLTQALERFRDKIQKPLKLPGFRVTYKTKTSSNGLGIPYFQAYLYPEDQRHKTKICIRSRVK